MANYYIAAAANGGSNANAGTQLLPMLTLSHGITTLGAAAGTVYGNGGDVFRETVTVGANGQTFGSYGTGQPIISGADVITGWAADVGGYTVQQDLAPTPNDNNGFGASASQYLAGSFTTTGAYTLTQAGVALAIFNGTPELSAVSCYIYNDSTNSPGSVIGTATATRQDTLGASPAYYTWQFTGVALSATTRYWVVLKLGTGTTTNKLKYYLHTGSSENTHISSDGATWGSAWDAGEQLSVQLYKTGAGVANVYNATIANPTYIVMANSARKTLGASKAALTDGHWFYGGGVLSYCSAAGNPTTLGLVMEAGQRDTCINSNGYSSGALTNLILQYSQEPSSSGYSGFFLHTGSSQSAWTMTGCTFRHHYGCGAVVSGTSDGITFTSCTFDDNGQDGLNVLTGVHTNYTFTNSTFSNNGWRTDTLDPGSRCGLQALLTSGTVSGCLAFGNGIGTGAATEHGLYFGAVTGEAVVVHDCTTYSNSGNGIKAYGGVTVYNNISYSNGYGIAVGSGAFNCVISLYRNVVYGNGNAGLYLDAQGAGTCSVTAANNVSYANNQTSNVGELYIVGTLTALVCKNNIFLADSTHNYTQVAAAPTSCAMDYNCFYGSSGSTPFKWAGTSYNFADYKTASSQDAHSLNAAPLFVNAGTGDFHLQAGSPCIDAGVVIAGINDGT